MLAFGGKDTWQDALSQLVTDPEELLELLALPRELLQPAQLAALAFPLKVPRGYLARIEKSNPHDPLLKQILPLGVELDVMPGYSQDPLQEVEVNPVPGLLHKYHGRVLVTLTSACAVHCRYCFRRHFPYADNNPGTQGWVKIADYIRRDASITEVILSGGDPLSVSDRLLQAFTDQLSGIPHLKRLRIHTRMPIVLPERVTHGLLGWLKALPYEVVMVVHANHPQEINDEVAAALRAIRNIGVTLLNQTVLLRDINDNVATLAALSESLFAAGVMPYYLHVLDKVQGAQHFDMSLATAQSLHAEMAAVLPGYLVPRLVQEEPGKPAKTTLSSTGLYTG
jgi:EF-P beta-lysylation protein EpmB